MFAGYHPIKWYVRRGRRKILLTLLFFFPPSDSHRPKKNKKLSEKENEKSITKTRSDPRNDKIANKNYTRENCNQRQSPKYRNSKMLSFERCSGANSPWCVSVSRALPICQFIGYFDLFVQRSLCVRQTEIIWSKRKKKQIGTKNWAIFQRTEPLRAAITCQTGAGRQTRYISIAPRSDTVKTSNWFKCRIAQCE